MIARPATRLLAALVPALLLLPAAAHAEQVTVDDAVGDAKAFNFATEFVEGAEDEPLFLDAPAEASVDIVRTVVDHGRRVTVSTQFRDLVNVDEHSLDMRIFTPDGRFSLVAARADDGSAFAQLYPERIRAMSLEDVSDPSDPSDFRPCRSVRARYDLAADLVTVSFPATCVGAPRWIQVASVASRLAITPIGDGSVNLAGYADDAFRGGLSENSRGRSPKVRRG